MKRILLLSLILASVCVPAFGQYPVTDEFTGSGALVSNWTSFVGSSTPGTCTMSSGVVSGGPCASYWSSNSFNSFGSSGQYSQVKVDSKSGNSGPAVLMGPSGGGYVWLVGQKQIFKISKTGALTAISGYICSYVGVGDTVRLSYDGVSTLTCTNNGGAAASVTDTTYTSGSPGVYSMTSGHTVKGTFQADCYPTTCGVLATPISTPAAGTFGDLKSVSFNVPSGSVDCYTTDGSAPTSTTFGVCANGTTYTGGVIALPAKTLNTINILATSGTYSVKSTVGTYVFNNVGVTMTANGPFTGFPLFVGTVINLNTTINFGTLNTVTAAIANNYGGATGSLNSTGVGPSVRTLTVGGTSGQCTIPQVIPIIHGVASGGVVTRVVITKGGSGLPANSTFQMKLSDGTHTALATITTNSSGVAVSGVINSSQTGFANGSTNEQNSAFPLLYQITSPSGFDVIFTSVDDPTVTSTFHIKVCNTQTDVEVLPFYLVRYSGQGAEFQALTSGTGNINTTWSITSQPSGGDGVLDPNPLTACEITHSCLTTYFVATVAGRYTIRACNAVDTGACQHATVFITGNRQPRNVQPNGTEVIDPTADPYGRAHGGVVIDIGPSQAVHTINATDFRSIAPGTTFRLHNEGANGSPTTYPEWWFFYAGGAQDNPIRFVGVPNASGELPVIEATNAIGPKWPTNSYNTYVFSGVINSWPKESTSGCLTIPRGSNIWAAGSAGSCGPNWIVIEGIRIQNANKANLRYDPGNAKESPWNFDAAGVAMHSGYGWVVRGVDSYNNVQPFATYTPKNAGFPGVTQMVDFEGNRCQLYGSSTDFTEHCFYMQSLGGVIAMNNIVNPTPGDQGSNIKTRSYMFVTKYNFLGIGATRSFDHVEIQDAPNSFSLDSYLCGNGDCNPATNPYPIWVQGGYSGSSAYFEAYNGQTGIPVTVMAGYEQAGRNNWDVGNVVQATPGQEIVHFGQDHYSANVTMIGTLHVLNNTFLNTQYAFDSLSSGGGSTTYAVQEYQTFDVQNNIIDTNVTTMGVNLAATFIGNFGHNLFRSNGGVPTVNIVDPVNTCSVNSLATCGWNNNTNVSNLFTPIDPITSHTTGINSSNFLFTPVMPVDPTTYMPISGSLAIGAGAVATGIAANFPARMQFNPSLGYATLRVAPLTLGAMDPPVPPVLPSITVKPNPGSVSYH